MAKTNAVEPMNVTKLQQIRSDAKKMSKTALAKKYKVGSRTIAAALAANGNLNKFKTELAAINAKEAEQTRKARAAKKHNEKKVEAKAAEIIDEPREYTGPQAKALIDGLLVHTGNLEERLQTLSSLLVESDDNIVTRIYRLENKKGIVRRFLERF